MSVLAMSWALACLRQDCFSVRCEASLGKHPESSCRRPCLRQVYYFPRSAASLGDHPGAFAALAAAGVATSFLSTLMFTALGSFYNRISDPDMGGAYLTLLNTIANMGAHAHSAVRPAEPILGCLSLVGEPTVSPCDSSNGPPLGVQFNSSNSVALECPCLRDSRQPAARSSQTPLT